MLQVDYCMKMREVSIELLEEVPSLFTATDKQDDEGYSMFSITPFQIILDYSVSEISQPDEGYHPSSTTHLWSLFYVPGRGLTL